MLELSRLENPANTYVISTTGDRTNNYSMQKRELGHRFMSHRSDAEFATTWPNVSWRYVLTTEDTATSGATSSQVEVILFINPSARAGYDTRSIFKRSLTGLNSEFSFS